MLKKLFFVLLLTTFLLITFFYQTTLKTKPHGIRQHPYKEIFIQNIINSPKYSYPNNFPDIYFSEKTKNCTNFNESCANFPQLFDIEIKNDYWQMQKTSNGILYLFGTYLDRRRGMLVRILGMYNQYHLETTFYCQFWYTCCEKPLVVQSEVPFWLFRQGWGADSGKYNQPYLITCPVELVEDELPFAVSLVENPCDNATNNLKIMYKEVKKKKNFVVCVKGLSFPYDDKTARLAEWIELLILLGAEKINFYEFSVHPNSKKLLDYYEEEGKVEVTPLTLVGDMSNHPFLQNQYLHRKIIERRLQEVIPYNDCLYKHLDEFRFVVLLDTDEVIIPVEGTWLELMKTLQSDLPYHTSYVARNVYFLDNHLHEHDWFKDIPKYMHMLQHVFRARTYTKPMQFVKGFHDTRLVIALHNHYPFLCYRKCDYTEINLTLAHLQHYRSDCVYGVSACNIMKKDSIMDSRVWNFKEELIKRVQKTLEYLNFWK